MVRTPLYLKLMVSYVVVVALAVLPTFVYVRMIQTREMRAVLRDELAREVANLASGLSKLPPDELDPAIKLALATSPRRLTVIDPSGTVVGDTAPLRRTPDNHLQRAEIQGALASAEGIGTAERHSASLDDEETYAAARVPLTGAPRYVVRFAASAAALVSASTGSVDAMTRAAGVAATAAILLSLVAALLVSRPLRRIAEGARAFAQGDFGHDITVHSRDELGEVSEALEELAARLQERLHAVGAERAAIRALLDDLPVGVVIYGLDRSPEIVGGRARSLCELTPDTEVDRCLRMLELPGQPPVVERVLRDGMSAEAPLLLPWKPSARLTARWIPLPVKDGSRQLALVVLDHRETEERLARSSRALTEAARHLREAARACPQASLAADLQEVAQACETAVGATPPTASEVRPVALARLCELAAADLAPLATTRGVSVLVEAAPAMQVVEAGGRMAQALRRILAQAVRDAADGEQVALRAEPAETCVRIFATSRRCPADLDEIGQLVHALGGAVGHRGEGEKVEAWLQVPKA